MASAAEPEDTAMTDAVDASEDAIESQVDRKLYDAMFSMLEHMYEWRDADGHDPSKLFHKRPNKRAVPGYYDVIREPMAMSVIKSKIREEQYGSFAEFVRDCALIWHNAHYFNRPDSQAYVDATAIRAVMEKELQEMVKQELIDKDETRWPDLGEVPEIEDEPEGAGEDDAESDDDDDEDDAGDISEAEAHKPRRPARRPSAPRRGDSQAESSNKRRGRPPKVDTPLEARMKNVLKALRKPKHDNGEAMIIDFEKLPDKSLADYYQTIKNPICVDQIKRHVKRKRYADVDAMVRDVDLMFNNAKEYNMSNSDIYRAAVQLQELAHQVATQEKQKPDDAFTHDEGRKPKPGGILHDGQLWKVGDWVHIQNPNDATKPIVAQLYRTWEDEFGQDWVNACWYYRPEQTVHHFEKHFWPNEVLKTSQYRDHPIEQVIDKCFVMFYTRFSKGRPKGLPEGTEVYVCEARYNEAVHKINKIKTWSSCLPDEVRDHDYELVPFEASQRIRKIPTPLQHLVADAKEYPPAPLPQPKMGIDDAPPVQGGVYKGARDENQSPPPSPSPSPQPAPVQPAHNHSSTPARDQVSRAGQSNQSVVMTDASTPNVAQSAHSQGHLQSSQHRTGITPQTSHTAHNIHPSIHPTPHEARPTNHDAFDTPITPHNQPMYPPLLQGQRLHSSHGPMVLSDHVNSQIPKEVRELHQQDDEGRVLFWPNPPLHREDACDTRGTIPSHMRTSLKYRASKLREKALARKRAAEDPLPEQNGDTNGSKKSRHNIDSSAMGINLDGTSENEQNMDSTGQSRMASEPVVPLWLTSPIEEHEYVSPSVKPDEILEINPLRIYPPDNDFARDLGYRSALHMAAAVHRLNCESYKRQYGDKWEVEMLQASIARIESRGKKNQGNSEQDSREEREHDENDIHGAIFRPQRFFIDDVDPQHMGTWAGQDPFDH